MKAPNASAPRRYLALDAMRGLTVVLMILVNMAIDAARSFGQLLHSVWNGFTLADAIFPCFLFVVGSAMALTFGRIDQPPPDWGRILRRAALLVGCGIFVSNFPFGHFGPDGAWAWKGLDALRLPGVLQRIGLCYLIGALVVRAGGSRGALLYCFAALPLAWWLTTNCGDLTLAGSAALKVDGVVFGPAHLYTGEGQPFDPEGLFGALPSVANLLGGYLAVHAIRVARDERQVLGRLALAGLAMMLLALAWSQVLPLNKKLWTSSFALLNIGLDSLVLAMLAWLIDLRGWRGGLGFLGVFGKNSLALYMIAEVLMGLAWTFSLGARRLFVWIYEDAFAGAVTGRFGSLLFGLVMVALCWAVGAWMDRKRIYIRL